MTFNTKMSNTLLASPVCLVHSFKKMGTVKEPVEKLITGFLVELDGRINDVINNLIIIYLNYINN